MVDRAVCDSECRVILDKLDLNSTESHEGALKKRFECKECTVKVIPVRTDDYWREWYKCKKCSVVITRMSSTRMSSPTTEQDTSDQSPREEVPTISSSEMLEAPDNDFAEVYSSPAGDILAEADHFNDRATRTRSSSESDNDGIIESSQLGIYYYKLFYPK